MCPTGVDTHHSSRLSPDTSVLFNILTAASRVSLWPDFTGLDHYSYRSLAPREQFILPLQKDAVPHLRFPPKATLKPCWSSFSERSDGRVRGSAVTHCDSEDVAFCIQFKACASETEQLRASLQLSGCRVASSRFSMKTNSRKNNTNGNIEYVSVCFYLCLQRRLHFTRHKREFHFLLFHFFAVLILHRFSAVSPIIKGK